MNRHTPFIDQYDFQATTEDLTLVFNDWINNHFINFFESDPHSYPQSKVYVH